MRTTIFYLLLTYLLPALFLCALFSHTAHAWSDPILVTPDSASSRHSRVVFDNENNMHFFFTSDRYMEIPYITQWDIFHCKLTARGERLTEDVRLDTTQSHYYVYPSALLGSDNKLHVAWADILSNEWAEHNGIYYSRLDTEGNIEREATRIAEQDSPADAFLFQDSDNYLNIVWAESRDTLFYCKFDTSCQIVIPKTSVYVPGSEVNIWYMEACMDHQDQIHCVYKNYYGTGSQRNVGYSRVTNQGEVLISYAPLTPENPDSNCSKGYIVADLDDNLHFTYLLEEFGYKYRYYRKMDRDLNTIYNIRLVPEAIFGGQMSNADIEIDGDGNAVITFAFIYPGIDYQFLRATYTTNGVEIISPELIVDDNSLNYPDLATDSNGLAVCCFTSDVESLPNAKILYCYTIDDLTVTDEQYSVVGISIQLKISPNPFHDTQRFQLTYQKGGNFQIRIIDTMGRIVQDYGNHFLQGSRSLTFEKKVSSGVYYLEVSNDQERIIKPIIKLK